MRPLDRWFSARFLHYLGVASGVGVVTVACRELLGLAWDAHRGVGYTASVGGAYAVGIALNYVAQGRYTFSASTGTRHRQAFARFVLVALAGGLMNMACSSALLVLLYQGPRWLAGPGPMLAFVFGTLLVAPFSYYAAGRWVFSR